MPFAADEKTSLSSVIPLQAIYGWNGADRMLFDTLPDVIGRTTVLTLPNN